jgi:hypothetical protein
MFQNDENRWLVLTFCTKISADLLNCKDLAQLRTSAILNNANDSKVVIPVKLSAAESLP